LAVVVWAPVVWVLAWAAAWVPVAWEAAWAVFLVNKALVEWEAFKVNKDSVLEALVAIKEAPLALIKQA
jgi:hypothetical protein